KPPVRDNIKSFDMLYVYTRPETGGGTSPPQGWYEVGQDARGNNLGWIKAEDVLEWDQAMIMVFTHVSTRSPVLMFKDRKLLSDALKWPADDRARKAKEWHATVRSKNIPPDFPIVTMESRQLVDITKEFYLYPILEAEKCEIQGHPDRLLKIAMTVKGGAEARTGSDLQTNKKYTAAAAREPTQLEKGCPDVMKANIVFVIDMTNSMQRYIDKTVEVIREISIPFIPILPTVGPRGTTGGSTPPGLCVHRTLFGPSFGQPVRSRRHGQTDPSGPGRHT
ncbi:MAG: hypothetical protein HQK57_09680, partial [Deltaproteobacteria bacterium]|nr:hypothetical protein [Deltaproteobacteria bacterium]